jgi:type VI secretion system protein ImpL
MDEILFRFIKSRLPARLLGLTAFCALLWFGGPLLALGTWRPLDPQLNRLLAIVIVLAIWAAYTLYEHFRARERGRQLMTNLSAPATGADRQALEEAQGEEIAALRGRFEEALHLLKKTSKKGRLNSAFMYELPWYVIIGGPGAGKTTFLRNSGLDFPLSGRLGDGPVRGVGGTRNCDWFFTDEAIFLDTAGRYTTHDSYQPVDKAAWTSFLGLLKKYRPRRPINGVLLAMSMSELVEMSEEERSRRARELRLRINELYKTLSNRFPIYMIFTKCDLIAGFSDFFSELTQAERSQVWGETFPLEVSKQRLEELISRLETNFDEVLGRLEHWTLKRIQEERDVNRRGAIFCYPQQLATIKPVISAFLRDIFGSSRFEIKAFLRGVYFTSGTQEGTPIDRIMGVLAGVYGMERHELPVFQGRPKSFFITRLLKEVILPEAELAGLDPRIESRRIWLQRAAYGSLFLLTFGLLTLWSVSYLKNSRAIAQVQQKLNNYRLVSTGPATPDDAMRSIIKRLDAIADAKRVYGKHSWTMGFGLYQGDKVNAGVNEVYGQRLMADLLPQINLQIKQQMRQILARSNDADSGYLYELLRTYLMLALPERMNTSVASSSIRDCFERIYPREPKFQQQIEVHSDALLKVLDKPMPVDRQLVENARQKLKSVPLGTQLYNQLKSVALADHTNDFRLLDAVPRAGDVFVTKDGKDLESISIPGFYTSRGYDAYFRKQGLDLVQRTLKEDWVLNQYPERQQTNKSTNLTLLYGDLQRQYFAEYALVWRKMLSNLTIKKPKGIYGTIQVLDQLSGPDTPLRPLLRAVEKNTRLGRLTDSKQAAAAEKGSPLATPDDPEIVTSGPAVQLESGFQALDRLVESSGQAPPPLEEVIKHINEIRDLLMQVTGGANSEEQALKYAQERMNGFGAQDVMKRAGLEFSRLPEPLHAWLSSLAATGWATTLENAKSEMNSAWRTDVVNYYRASLDGRYPLFRNSRNDATMTDFVRFFGPQGIMDKFFATYLKSFVDTNTWRQESMDKQGIHLSAQVIREFQDASKIRNAFFAPGQSAPSVQFMLKPIYLDSDAASFRINIEGQTEEYAHGQSTAANFQWPGPNSNQGVILSFMTAAGKAATEMEEGPWAWLRVLEKSNLQRTSLGDVFRITFQIGGHTAIYELRANSVFNPFNLPELHRFRLSGSL